MLVLIAATSCSRDIVVMSYNVENLFDDKNNGSEYPEYKPKQGRWTTDMYLLRLRNLANVIDKSVPGGPDIIAFQEIENRNVLDGLSGLLGNGKSYPYVCMVEVPDSPTNTAIVSRYPVKSTGAYSLPAYDGEPLRNILLAEIDADGETLYVFCNHWKSRDGGVEKTEAARLEAAALLLRRVEAIHAGDPRALIVIAGDLNENADEYARVNKAYGTAIIEDLPDAPQEYRGRSIFVTGDTSLVRDAGGAPVFFEPWMEEGTKEKGSYAYRGEWESIDHLLFSKGFFDNAGIEYVKGSFKTVRMEFLADEKTGFPKSWDNRVKNGYSDHFPILVRLARN